MLYGSIPAIIGLLFFLPTGISSYRNLLPANARFVPVKVRVDSIQLKHVPAELVASETVFKEVFYLPELYMDLWVAQGDVTIQAKDGQAVDPIRTRATFTVPNIYSTGSGRSYKAYICHYKMDAEIDSERYKVGEIYSGWALRDMPADVFFTRPSDRRLLDLMILASLLLGVCIYFVVRIAIGMKLQDQHWVGLENIWKDDLSKTKRV